MVIMKNSSRVSWPDGDLSPRSPGGSAPTEEEVDNELCTQSSASGSEATEGEEEGSDADSGMGSDVYDLSEMGEAGTELCQVGDQTCCVPLELYDLPDLRSVLSLESWNELLSEEERLALAAYLPDMDQETFVRTLTDLLSGANFHFGSPLVDLFARLKGGLCEPRVVLGRRASNLLQRHHHYHFLRRYQNNMVGNLFRIKNAWHSCKGYSIEEKLQFLNSLKTQRQLLGWERDGGMESETDSQSEDSGERFQRKKPKMGRSKPLPDILSRGSGMIYKENPKGLLKVAPKGFTKKGYVGEVDRYPLPLKRGLEVKSRPSRPLMARSRHEQMYGYDEEEDNGDFDQGDWNSEHGSALVRSNLLKSGKKQELLEQYNRQDSERYAGLPYSHSKSRSSNQAVTIASYGRPAKNVKYSEKEWPYPPKDWNQSSQADWFDTSQTLRPSKMSGKGVPLDNQAKFDDWNARGENFKAGGEFGSGKSRFATDIKANKPYKMFSSQMGDSRTGSRASGEKTKSKYARNGGRHMEYSRSYGMLAQSEVTESDSSDGVEEDGDLFPMARKSEYPISAVEGHQSGVVKSIYNPKKASKLKKKDSKRHAHYVGGDTSNHAVEIENYTSNEKQKGKTNELGYMLDQRFVRDQLSDKLKLSAMKNYSAERKRKRAIDSDHPSLQSNYIQDYGIGPADEEAELDGSSRLVDAQVQADTFANRVQVAGAESDFHRRPKTSLTVCNSVTKKRKGKLDDVYVDQKDEPVYRQSSPMKQFDDPNPMKKVKKNIDTGAGSLTAVTPDKLTSEKGPADTEAEMKTQKKTFTLITPTVHTGFSFSIIHLLSAIRKALITPYTEDTASVASHLEKDGGKVKQRREEQNKILQSVSVTDVSHCHDNMDSNPSESAGQKNLPSITVQEIVNRVRSNPGDPYILETQEPLQDLVRGVLKIFSSKTAPLGAKGWKVLVSYEKSDRSWSWVGPFSSNSSDIDAVEEETSAEAWGIPHKMLVKLVDAFANWLKNGQETLQQIGSLPPPPTMAPILDEKERFRDLRAQKSLNTISPSSDEVRAYFRKEELLRYSIPDRAFSYTAVDGKKSIVAPLRRGGGKPTSKARDHFMLKPDRPPHVTILCLVRDAAARLPGSIGTRADVCTLIRDSQYIVEDVTDAQVNQVVSGALDRLHYERDPCVQFDGERKLWVYLHRDREEEDFEDDGTSSTKKWKKQKKDATENSDVGAANDMTAGDPVAGGSAGYGFNADLNIDTEEKVELVYDDIRPNTDNVQSFIGSTSSSRSQPNPLHWEVLGMNALHDNKMLCQENSTNEDFDGEAYRERPVGLLGASLL